MEKQKAIAILNDYKESIMDDAYVAKEEKRFDVVEKKITYIKAFEMAIATLQQGWVEDYRQKLQTKLESWSVTDSEYYRGWQHALKSALAALPQPPKEEI